MAETLSVRTAAQLIAAKGEVFTMRCLILLSIFMFPAVALAATLADLGDLNVGSNRIPRWYPAAEAEQGYLAAKSWPEYDATCANAPCSSGRQGFRDAPGNPMGSCSAANPADNGGQDWSQINCMIDNAPGSSVIYVPAGTYDMGDDNGEVIKIGRGNIVLRGAGMNATHMRIAHAGSGNGVIGATNCSDHEYPANNLCGAGVVSVGYPYEGSAVNWTGGYTEETTTITVSSTAGFSVGGWIHLEIDNARVDCPLFLPEPVKDPNNSDNALNHTSKIIAINGNQITMDRGLRMTYSQGNCTNSALARPYRAISRIGVEGIHFTTAPSINPDILHNLGFVTFGAGTVESWAVGNKLERAEARVFMFRMSARNWLQGNRFENYGRIDTHFNTSGVTNTTGAVDNVIENNAWKDFVVGVYNLQGTEGIVVAYNYLRYGSPPNAAEKSLFNHGLYTREVLFEGNDADGMMMTADHWWGSNGARITAFRNRLVGSGAQSQINVNRDKTGSWKIADRVNWIGNTSTYYLNSPNCNGGFPDCLSGTHDMDANVTNMHLEKNIFRNNDTCNGDPSSGRCGFHLDSPVSSTSCGTANGPGDCAGGTGSNAGGNSAPGGWAGDDVPHSLYRVSSQPPIWWCEEACSWENVHAGVGAWGDNFGGQLCKLPAQILAEGGTCTASAGSSGGDGGGGDGGGGGPVDVIEPPILLP